MGGGTGYDHQQGMRQGRRMEGCGGLYNSGGVPGQGGASQSWGGKQQRMHAWFSLLLTQHTEGVLW